MKNIILIFALCTVSSVNADMYKCISGEKTSYQFTPCLTLEDENKFSLKYDISKEQIKEARDKKEAELAIKDEQKMLDEIAYDKERMIRAEEIKAREAILQTDAMRERNDIERNIRHDVKYIKYDVKTLKNRSRRRLHTSNHIHLEEKNEKKQPSPPQSNSKRLARIQ